MFKNVKILSVILVLFFSFNLALACEIELKNGRIITAEYCWEEGSKIKYEKYGAIIILKKEDVEKIIDKEYEIPKSYGTAVVFLKDGNVISTENTWVEGNIVYCQTKKRLYTYKKEEVSSIGAGSFTVSSKTLINGKNCTVGDKKVNFSGCRHALGTSRRVKPVGPTTDFEAIKGRKPTDKEIKIYKEQHKVSGGETDAYGIPKEGWLKAGSGEPVVVVGQVEGEKMHFLRESKGMLQKMLTNVDDVVYSSYSNANKEKIDQVKSMLNDQLIRTDNLINYVQAGGDFGDRSWSERLKREFSPKLEAFNQLERDYINITEGLYRAWNRANVAEKYKDVFDGQHYWAVERKMAFFSEDHRKIQNYVESGDIEKAKEVWKEVKEREKRFLEARKAQLKGKTEKYPGVLEGRIPDYYSSSKTKVVENGRISEVERLEKYTEMEMKKRVDNSGNFIFEKERCPMCNGTGKIRTNKPVFADENLNARYHSQSQTPDWVTCFECGGTGVVNKRIKW
jgi:hypothetical protein